MPGEGYSSGWFPAPGLGWDEELEPVFQRGVEGRGEGAQKATVE